MSNGNDKKGTFNSKTSSESETQKQAFREAKFRNGIARGQQPDSHPTSISDRNNANKTQTEYKFTSLNNDKITIRKDNPTDYKRADGAGNQGPHYNAGPTTEKQKQHHNYQRENK